MIKYKHIAGTVLAIAAALFATASCSQDQILEIEQDNPVTILSIGQPSSQAVQGLLKVKLRDEVESIDQMRKAVPGLSITEYSRLFPECGRFEERTRAEGLHRWYCICFNEEIPLTKAAVDAFRADGIEYVEYVEPVKPHAAGPFNDPRFEYQWHYLNNGGMRGSIAGCDINLLEAWNYTTGSDDIIVAIVDEGIRYTHEDLRDAMWINEAEKNGEVGVDDDGNGYVDDFYGYNFCLSAGGTMLGSIQPGDHGTHTAGTIGAVNNNGIGVCGVAGGDGIHKGVRLMSVQAIGANGSYPDQGIKYAADNGAIIANNSWGFTERGYMSQSVADAIDYFVKYAGIDENGRQVGPMAGGLCIFSAGNESTDLAYPAAYEKVMAVAAFGNNWKRSAYTNYGEWVDISAPGGNLDEHQGGVMSTTAGSDNSYDNYQGTSMASPHVAGVAALVVSRLGGPGFTCDDLWNLLISSANPVLYEYNYGFEGKLGAGAVDAGKALQADGPTPPEKVAGLACTANANSINLSWIVPKDEEAGKAAGFRIFCLEKSAEGIDFDSEDIGDGKRIDVRSGIYRAGERMEYTIVDLKFNTKYYIIIFAYDNLQNVSVPSSQMTTTTGKNCLPQIKALTDETLVLKSFETGEIRYEITDPDGHPLQITGMTTNGLKSEFDGKVLKIVIEASSMRAGKYSDSFTVSDGYDSVTRDFGFEVLENRAPQPTGQMDNILLNSKTATCEIDLHDWFSDEDGEELTYTVQSSSTSVIVKTEVNAGKLLVTGNWYGTTELTITAADRVGAAAQQVVQVLVRDGSQEIELYPNPATDFFCIRTGQQETGTVSLYNAVGAKVVEQSVSFDPFSPAKIDVSHLSAGTYVAKIKLSSKDYSLNVIKL